MKQRASQIVNELSFYQIGKEHHREIMHMALRQEPMQVYHSNLNTSTEICLPLVNKVINKKLILQDYTLDSGHMLGLAKSISQTKKPEIEAILFDNCGIDDKELAILLEGLTVAEHFEKFVYKNNVFMHRGVQALKPILIKPDPHHLLELRLVNCTTTETVIENLLNFMAAEKVPLRTLSLVRMQVTRRSMESVATLV